MSPKDVLHVSELRMEFGGLVAVDGISLIVHPQEIFAIIGPNGAGKTTVFNCVSGFYKPTSGHISFAGEAIAGLPSHQVARRGIVRTFQNIRLFKHMTALENLQVAQHMKVDNNFLSGLFTLPRYRRMEKEALEKAAFWLDRVGLGQYANREAGTLAYGHQRRLEIARCMITDPRLLLLDEPAAGLNPQEKIELQHLIDRLRLEHNVAVLLIEHDMRLVMDVSDRILVMEYGRPIATDTPERIRKDERVIKAYLGED